MPLFLHYKAFYTVKQNILLKPMLVSKSSMSFLSGKRKFNQTDKCDEWAGLVAVEDEMLY